MNGSLWCMVRKLIIMNDRNKVDNGITVIEVWPPWSIFTSLGKFRLSLRPLLRPLPLLPYGKTMVVFGLLPLAPFSIQCANSLVTSTAASVMSPLQVGVYVQNGADTDSTIWWRRLGQMIQRPWWKLTFVTRSMRSRGIAYLKQSKITFRLFCLGSIFVIRGRLSFLLGTLPCTMDVVSSKGTHWARYCLRMRFIL